MTKRVVVTGIGALAPQGNDPETFWSNVVQGKPGAGPITHFDASSFRTRFACELHDFDPADHLDHGELKRTDPFTQYALVASDQAIADAGLEVDDLSPFEVGVIWGSGQGGMVTYEEQVTDYVQRDFNPRFSPFFVPKFIVNMASGMISMRNGFMGINYTTVSACATGNTAIMDAFNYIRWGKAKAMITGASEAPITPASIGGFAAMRAMSTRNEDPESASRPFDVERDGFVMAEGAAALVLEEYEHARQRGANIYAEIVGAAMTADAHHMTATHPEGIGAVHAMESALDEAGLTMHDVDYLNPHATSTPVGDVSEAKAIRTALGDGQNDLQISATKSMTGHLMGAAGAIEALICIKAIETGVIPPTINTTNIDPDIEKGLNIVLDESIDHPVRVAMSNTFGFGGHNGVVVMRAV